MRKKVIVLALMLISGIIFLPEQTRAASGSESTSITLNNSAPQIRVQIGRQRRGRNWNRGRHRGWEKGRHRGWNNNGRNRLVRQVYWRNGRRYVRYVRIHT